MAARRSRTLRRPDPTGTFADHPAAQEHLRRAVRGRPPAPQQAAPRRVRTGGSVPASARHRNHQPRAGESSSSRCSAARCRLSGPTTAASTGPASAACAVARSQPATRGARVASGGSSEEDIAGQGPVLGGAGERRVAQQGAGKGRRAAGGGVVERVQRRPAALGVEHLADSPAVSVRAPSATNRSRPPP